jgi:hypothetical protein
MPAGSGWTRASGRAGSTPDAPSRVPADNPDPSSGPPPASWRAVPRLSPPNRVGAEQGQPTAIDRWAIRDAGRRTAGSGAAGGPPRWHGHAPGRREGGIGHHLPPVADVGSRVACHGGATAAGHAYRRSTVLTISGGASPGMVSGWLNRSSSSSVSAGGAGTKVRWWMRTMPKLGCELVRLV